MKWVPLALWKYSECFSVISCLLWQSHNFLSFYTEIHFHCKPHPYLCHTPLKNFFYFIYFCGTIKYSSFAYPKFFCPAEMKEMKERACPLALWNQTKWFLSFPVCCDKVTIFFHFTLKFIFIVSHILICVIPHLKISFISFISAGLFNYELCKRVLHVCVNQLYTTCEIWVL